MSKVPAWKRAGLKVKEDAVEGPVVAVTHFDGSALTNKVAKKLKKKRQEDKNDTTKKPPKRVKKPKSERGPPPEKDQLLYLRQFVQDKETWKFSKQKQNWLLKNIESVPQDYENDLIAYFEDIQGGARRRTEEDLRIVIKNWNEYSRKLEEKVNAELCGKKGDKEEIEEPKTDESEEKKGEGVATVSVPSKEYALRCKKLLSAMLEEPVHMEGHSADDDVDPTVEVPQNAGDYSEKYSESSPENDLDTVQSKQEDNLIIEEIDAEEYDQRVLFAEDIEGSRGSHIMG